MIGIGKGEVAADVEVKDLPQGAVVEEDDPRELRQGQQDFRDPGKVAQIS